MNLKGAIKAGVAAGQPLPDIHAGLRLVTKLEFYRSLLELIGENGVPNILRCFCGHDCSRCKVLHATIHDDEALRQESAAFYRDTFRREIPPEKLRCFGGRSGEVMEGCEGCPFSRCCREKGVERCTDCGEYPCRMIAEYEREYVDKVNQV